MKRPSDLEKPYRPVSGRRRLLIAVLAVVTAVVVILLMLQPKLRAMRAEQARKGADVGRCDGPRQDGCVGGTMGVIVAPAASAAP
jgi:hypothetical protein